MPRPNPSQNQHPDPEIHLLTSPLWVDYELLDSGDGMKLERFGAFKLARPEAEAIWKPALDQKEWASAHARFESSTEEHGGHWITNAHLPERWAVNYNPLKFWVQLSASRHVGVFPEQAAHWDWIQECIQHSGRPLKVLNLFGYTGLATLAAAAAGGQVTHLDASRKVVEWAKANQQASGMDQASIRYIVDDALKFVQREARRGARYDGLILDPPKFGRGPKGEVWEFYKLIPNLLDACKEIMTSQPAFLVITAYAVKASSLTLFNALTDLFGSVTGQCEAGELALLEKSAGRRLSTAVYARWSSNPLSLREGGVPVKS